jgi:two-component system OmpR family response regulator
MMPFKDGLTLAKEIREINETVPLIFLTAKNLKDDVLKGYRIGADDYLTKPFDSEILLAKIKTILNRKPSDNIQEKDEFEFNFSEFNFNSKLRILTHKEGESFKLSPKENQLLKMLVSNFDDLLPRDIALNKIWRDANYFTSRSMDVYIAKLRKYLEKDPSLKIINVHGEGFRLTKD